MNNGATMTGCAGTLRGIVVGIVVLVGLGVGWLVLFLSREQSAFLRYELVATVDVGGQTVSGSVVQEIRVTARATVPMPHQIGITSDIRGQALALDLPGVGTLFVPMRSEGWDNGYISDILRSCVLEGTYPDQWAIADAVAAFKGGCDIDRKSFPLLVRFEDELDPQTIQRVDPDDLTGAFGAAVGPLTLSFRTTEAEVTTGIETRLPWVAESESLGRGHFVTGDFPRGIELRTEEFFRPTLE